MKTKLIIIAASLMLASGPAMADCASQARDYAARKGGEVISVSARQKNNGDTLCDVTIRVPGKNGKPPRLETRTVKD